MLLFARSILKCGDLARDAVQETLILLWERETMPTDLDNWLVRMAALRALQMRRALLRRRQNELDGVEGQEDHEHCTDPIHQLLHAERRTAIRRAVSELPEPMREVVFLRDLTGLEYAAIARAVGVPVGTVRSRLSRARQVLSVALSEEKGTLEARAT